MVREDERIMMDEHLLADAPPQTPPELTARPTPGESGPALTPAEEILWHAVNDGCLSAADAALLSHKYAALLAIPAAPSGLRYMNSAITRVKRYTTVINALKCLAVIFLLIAFVKNNLHILIDRRRNILTDIIRPDREFSMAAVHQDR